MFNQKRNKKTSLKKMTFELAGLDTDKFNIDELVNVLENVTFDLININLSTSKENIGLNGRGFMPIGLVNKFYITEGKCLFDVAIFEKYISKVEALDNDDTELFITARVFTNKEGRITKIIGLDLTPLETIE